jgi:hypothetical protein
MTYVILRPVTTVIGVIATLTNVYGDGELRYDRFYPYSALINGVAQFWALYCLVLMYQVPGSLHRHVNSFWSMAPLLAQKNSTARPA